MARGKKPGDRPDLLTKDEMDRLINVVAGDLFFTTLYKVLRYSGRRTGEVVGTIRGKQLTGGIKVGDINFETGEMKTVILKTKKRKLQQSCQSCDAKNSHKNNFCNNCGARLPGIDEAQLKYQIPEEITMPMRKELPSILKIYIEKHRPQLRQKDYLFRKYSLIYLKKKIKDHCKQASIEKNFSLHGFRHYFVTQMKRAGVPNEEIALWTGHKTPSTLNIYNRMLPKDVEAKIMDVEL